MITKLACLSLALLATVNGLAQDVLQHHHNASRDGRYTQPQLTQAAAASMHRDMSFYAPLPGPTYAQPLYLANGPGGRATLIVATEQNIVLAIDASDGSQIWTASLGAPVPLAQLPCGDIDPLGTTGTPVADATNRIIYADAMTTPDNGITKLHRVFALSLDDGSVLPGWPLDLSTVSYQGIAFDSTYQNQRGALLLHDGFLYVPYGGHAGDCGNYHGWVVGVPVNNPAGATGWATGAIAGGIWGPGGVVSDGHRIYAATGNTGGANTWAGGEAIVRLGAGATFSGNADDYFTPSNWLYLDQYDLDLGGSAPVLFDLQGASPPHLALALGKNGVAYILDREHLGGLGTGNGITGEGLQSLQVSVGSIINAAAIYAAPSGTYAVFHSTDVGVGCPGTPGDLIALRIVPGSPPSLSVAWCANDLGGGLPIVTTTDGTAQPIVWTIGAEDTNQLHAFNGETGAVLFAGGGPADQMSNVEHFQTAIAVNGRIFVAADYELYAFTVQTLPDPARR
jgi:hypothetical protein